ncbi:MAG TPA: protein kinase [Ktedonobacteraceae bacterium]|nr:protein kinase [Ktedonobacteraceae bacterium]
MTTSMSLMPGALVGGHYVVGALINRGGFGAVYRGIDTSEGNRPCAIKETYDVTPAARRQALMEAAVLFTIDSDHLPKVYDAFEDNGRFYLVMQLIEGQNLLEMMRQRGAPCSEQETLRWLLPIAEVLHELHSRRPAVMHRDIKPGNIIVTPTQTAVLVDFGLTKLYDPNVDTQTNVRAVSEGFSPIEQYRGKTSPQSDIYSLAATMYYLLTGYVAPAAMQRNVRETLIPPRQLNPRISPHVEQALLAALAQNATNRYDSMRDFIAALQPFQSPQQQLRLAQPSSAPSQPSYNGYADQTFAGSLIENGAAAGPSPAQASAIPSTSPALPASTLAPPPPQSPPLHRPWPARQKPGKGANAPDAPVYPYLPPRPKVAQPAPVIPIYKSLPHPTSQGCLWGMLQGVLSALLVLSSVVGATLKNPGSIYVAIFMGLFFYIVAGFFTTRKGGSALRGIWAGLWGGISSIVVFWIVFVVGLIIKLEQNIQQHASSAPPIAQASNLQKDLGNIVNQVASLLFNHSTTQQNNNGLVVYLVVGLVCAMAAGLLGGILGAARFRARMRKKGYI